MADGFDFNMNLLKCIAEAKNDVEAAKALIAELTAQSLPIEDAFEKTANLYNKVVVTVKDCGVEKIALPTIDNVAELKVCVRTLRTSPTWSSELTLMSRKRTSTISSPPSRKSTVNSNKSKTLASRSPSSLTSEQFKIDLNYF